MINTDREKYKRVLLLRTPSTRRLPLASFLIDITAQTTPPPFASSFLVDVIYGRIRHRRLLVPGETSRDDRDQSFPKSKS